MSYFKAPNSISAGATPQAPVLLAGFKMSYF